MKRKGNIYNELCSIENLMKADAIACKEKLHIRAVQQHLRNKDRDISILHEQLISGTYRPSPYHIDLIYEPKKREIIKRKYYPDKVVQQAIVNVVEPILTPTYTNDTYASIKGRGAQLAAGRIRKAMNQDRDGCRFALKLDVHHFFNSVDHKVLMDRLRTKIKDEKALKLMNDILDIDGIGIGDRTSQMYANFILSSIDHKMKEQYKCRHYFRYMDDIVILSGSKDALHEYLNEIIEDLNGLKLQIKSNYQIFPIATDRKDKHGRPLDFIGYQFHLNQTFIRKNIKKNLCRTLKKLSKKPTPEPLFKQRVASWWGWLKYSDSEYLIQKLNQTSKYAIDF